MKPGVSIATLFPKRTKQNSSASVSVSGFEIFVSQGENINRLSNFEVVIPMPYGIGFKEPCTELFVLSVLRNTTEWLGPLRQCPASIIYAYLEKCGHRK